MNFKLDFINEAKEDCPKISFLLNEVEDVKLIIKDYSKIILMNSIKKKIIFLLMFQTIFHMSLGSQHIAMILQRWGRYLF